MAGSIGRPRPKMPPEQLKKSSDYVYDYDRTNYYRKYYEKRRAELNGRAKKRYRAIITAKYAN